MEKIESIGLVLYNPSSLSNLALDKLMDNNVDLHIFIYFITGYQLDSQLLLIKQFYKKLLLWWLKVLK